MPASSEISKQLFDVRSQKVQAARLLFEASERVKQLEAKRKQMRFQKDLPLSSHRIQPTFDEQLEEARANRQKQQIAYDDVLQLEQNLFKAFLPVSDPIENINQLSSDYPIALLPLRMETRFRVDLNECWVRVFPDECAVDSFEPTLSEIEVRNAQTFWKRMWAAAGSEPEERAAWRSLVSSHGAGRARWIMNRYIPVNQTNIPTSKENTDLLLIIPTDTVPDNPQIIRALLEYWPAVWLADGRQVEEKKALDTLQHVLNIEAPEGMDATELLKVYYPLNLDEKPTLGKQKTDIHVSTVFLEFPKGDAHPTKRNSWSQPAHVDVMPDRLVLMGFNGKGEQILSKVGNPIPSPLMVTPDPSGDPNGQLKNDNGDLSVGEDLLWMVDFQRSIDWGLGFRVTQDDLNENALLKDGFQRLMALGIRLSADEQGGKELFQTLLQNHQNSSKGFSLLPQGTPTNNTESAGSDYSRSEDADDTFNLYVKQQVIGSIPYADGQILAEALGLDPVLCLQTAHGLATDQLESQLMNQMLFPGTLGYMLHTMLNPAITPSTIRKLRKYFNSYVSGRGSLPAIRIGIQPYGILPTTAFSRLQWFSGMAPDENTDVELHAFLNQLYGRLRQAHIWWSDMAKDVDHLGKSGDIHQVLMNILSLYPAAVEYHSRYAESFEHLHNLMNLQQMGRDFRHALQRLIPDANISDPDSTMARLRALGYEGAEIPDVLKLAFWATSQRLKGPVIDDRPLSEKEKIRPYTTRDRNYLQWLADSVYQSLDILRTQTGFKEDQPPQALLYILARYSLMNAFWESGINFQLDAKLLSGKEAASLRKEPRFIHVSQSGSGSESRWAPLYTKIPDSGGENAEDLTVEQYISRVLTSVSTPLPTHEIPVPSWLIDLREQIQALLSLAEIPTARLERLLAEHLDCCSYRLDAWELGLVKYHLEEVRNRNKEDPEKKPGGVYLGAYGWLENVLPENKNLSPVSLTDELDRVFNPKDAEENALYPALLQDGKNGGFIHAPSLNQAITAAILRAGYLANASEGNPQTLAVHLSSERVRTALSFIEGIRNGQSLGALLGYQLERGLHDRYQLEGDANDQFTLDEFIFKLRKEFPLQAGHIKSTSESDGTGPDVSGSAIETQEARNVIDGLSLVEKAKEPATKTYPFGTSLPLDISTAQKAAINAEVERLLDIYDALADLAMAESVHQVAQGNYDRASATLDAYGKSSFPPIPDVIQTPRSGINLTHRLGLHFESGLDPAHNPVAPGITRITPRGKGEPALNHWLASILPASELVTCKVRIKDPSTGKTEERFVSWQDLQVQPVDLLYLLRPENEQAMSELDDRVLRQILTKNSPRPDALLEICYTDPIKDKVTFFQLSSLIHSLRALVLTSRPLRSADVLPQGDGGTSQTEAVFIDRSRVVLVQQEMSTLHADLKLLLPKLARVQNLEREETSLKAEMQAEDIQAERLAEIEIRLAQIQSARATELDNVDIYLSQTVQLLEQASSFGLPHTGWGFAYSWMAKQFTTILEQLSKLAERWNQKLLDSQTLMEEYKQLPESDLEGRSRLIQRAELLLSIHATTPLITPKHLEDKQDTFRTRLTSINALLSSSEVSLSSLLNSIRSIWHANEWELVTPEVDEINQTDQRIILFVDDLFQIIQNLTSEIDRRLQAVQKKFEEHDSVSRPSTRVEKLLEASKILLGDDFILVPEFELLVEQRAEWQTARDDGDTLLKYLISTEQIDFPVDNWLYGLARVREKLHHWERVVMLTGAMGQSEPELTPVQLPYKSEDSWLALKFPQDVPSLLDGDRLLYTAHYTAGFDLTQTRQCGLLLDEWTEKLPGMEETTGIAFHFDRPNAEPPQTILLATSPNESGPWHWQDLVDTLNETLDLAKMRAVEPAQTEKESLNRLLPASMLAFTLREISISANLSENNQVMRKLP